MIKKNDMMSVEDVQEMLGVPLLGAIPEDTEVIVSTNRGEPLVLKKKLTLAGIAYENAARRVVGKQDFMIDLERPKKSLLQRTKRVLHGGEGVERRRAGTARDDSVEGYDTQRRRI